MAQQIELQTEQFNSRIVVVEKLATEGILGRNFLKENGCVIDVVKSTLHLADHGVTLPFCGPCTSVDEQPAKKRQQRKRERCDQGARKKSRRNLGR